MWSPYFPVSNCCHFLLQQCLSKISILIYFPLSFFPLKFHVLSFENLIQVDKITFYSVAICLHTFFLRFILSAHKATNKHLHYLEHAHTDTHTCVIAAQNDAFKLNFFTFSPLWQTLNQSKQFLSSSWNKLFLFMLS